MTMRTKIILLAIALITAIATVFAAMYKPKRSNTIVRPVIKITAELPLSGENSHLGLAAQQAIQNSLKQADDSAGYKYEVNYVDQNTPYELAPNTKAILSFALSPEPRVILTLNSTEQQSFMIHTPYEEVITLVSEVLKQKQAQSVGFITLAEGNYHLLAQQLNQALSPNYKFMGAVYKIGQTDFENILNLFINNDIEYYLITGSPAEADKLMTALHNRGISPNKIIPLYVADLSAHPELYNNTISIGSEAGTYDGGLSAAAVLALMDSYEKNYKKDFLPSLAGISEYLLQNKAPNNTIQIKATRKQIIDGKISNMEN